VQQASIGTPLLFLQLLLQLGYASVPWLQARVVRARVMRIQECTVIAMSGSYSGVLGLLTRAMHGGEGPAQPIKLI